MSDLIKDFQKANPGITVKSTTPAPHLHTQTALSNAIAAGKGAPDVVMLEDPTVTQFAVTGDLADLSQFGADKLADDFSAGPWNKLQYGGKPYALPIDSGPEMFFYNDAVFKKAGVDGTQIKTWDDYYEAAKKVRAIGSYMTNNSGSSMEYQPFTAQAWQAGAQPWKVDGENLTIDMTKDSGMKKYIEFQQKLIDEDLIDTKTANWSDDWNRELNDGTIASLTIGGWMPINLMNGAPDQAGNWRVAQLPQWEEGEEASAEDGGSALAVVSHPEAKFETVVVKPSEIQQDMVKSLSERAAEVHSGAVDPSVDNMLKITSDGRKTGLDQRLMNPLTPDDPDSKLNACVDNVLRIWNETKEDNLTQLIFCDMSTPKGDGSFNVYDDIRTKLLAAGVPESEVEFIHNADTEGKKADLFSKVRSGKVRVLLGSTAKMGAGTNVQTLLVAVHHLDVGWRPSDMTQRNGRIIRQGNKNKQVYVYNYVTEGTFDAYLWQTLENKQKFISQIMTSKSPMRSCDDVDEQALSYAEVKALCAGDPRIREKMDLDVQVAKLKVLRSDYQNQKYRLEDKLLKHYPEEIQKAKNRIAALKNDAQIADAHPQDKENFCGMTIKGMVFDEKKAAGERLMLACKEMPNADMMLLGTYRGFELNIRFDSFKNEHQIVLRGELSYPVPLGDDPRGNIVRLDNAIGNFADRIADADAALDSLEQQKQAAEVEIAKPFAQEEELQTKSARLAELDALLNMEHQSSRTEPEAEEKPDARPSVLAALEEKADKVEPVRPFKSYLDKDGDAR